MDNKPQTRVGPAIIPGSSLTRTISIAHSRSLTTTADPNTKSECSYLLGPVKAVPLGGALELLETFEAKDELGRKHLCLLFKLLGPSTEDLRQGNMYDGQNLLVHIVQKVIGDISGPLANLAYSEPHPWWYLQLFHRNYEHSS